jgi:hypothetical protein
MLVASDDLAKPSSHAIAHDRAPNPSRGDAPDPQRRTASRLQHAEHQKSPPRHAAFVAHAIEFPAQL